MAGGSDRGDMAKSLILQGAEVGGGASGDPAKSLKTKRRLGGAEVPHTPYELPPRSSAQRSSFGKGKTSGRPEGGDPRQGARP